jgi:NAD(P)-dependent dehydrogenase (short-subunit alcohol dehydrogenase family)
LKGIGLAIRERLEKDGHTVVSLSRSSTPMLDLAAPAAEIRAACDAAIEALGGVDALVVSAGQGAYLEPWRETLERREHLMRVNFHGPVECYHACLRELLRSRGRVLFIGSTVATRGAKGLAAYAASKGGLDAYVRSEARRLARHFVSMNVVSPGWVETEMTAQIARPLRAAILRSLPLRRMLEPGEVADFAVRVLGTLQGLTGQVLEISGAA